MYICTVTKILLTKVEAERLFRRSVVSQCRPFGFEKRLGWYFVEELLTVYVKETPDSSIRAEIFNIFLSDLPPSDLEENCIPTCRADLLLARYRDALQVLITSPSLDRIGATKLERLFSLSRGFVHSDHMKQRAITSNAHPARWSVSHLIKQLRDASAHTAKKQLACLNITQKDAVRRRNLLARLAKMEGTDLSNP